MKDLSVEDLCKKYPQYDSEIRDAYVAVLTNPDRDLEVELSGCDIDEEDIWGLITNINKTLWGESNDFNSVKEITEAILNGNDIRKSILEYNKDFAEDPEEYIKNYIENGGETVWILMSVGDPQDDAYRPEKLYIKSLDDGVLSLSREKGGEIIDRSPCDEVYLSKEDAIEDLKDNGFSYVE